MDKPYNFNHKCNTKVGSSGSPILSLNNKVIGIHKKGTKLNNIGTFLNYLIKDFIQQNFDKKIKNKNKRGLIGLANIGAYQLMNPTLQCLSNTKRLTEYFLNKYKDDPKKVISNEYYKLVKILWKTDLENGYYSPFSFKNTLKQVNPLFNEVNSRTTEVRDLINFLIITFHDELKINNPTSNINYPSFKEQLDESFMLKFFLEEINKNYNSPIFNLFYGINENKTELLCCKRILYNFQLYYFFDFGLFNVNQYLFNKSKKPLKTKEEKNPDINLYECFEYYTNPTFWEGDNQYYCNFCNKLTKAYFTTLIFSTPYYLIINLNRGRKDEYECKVNFPNKLNIHNYVINKYSITKYELYAIISYYCLNNQNGHFIAFCRSRTNNEWYVYNDSIVTKYSKQYEDSN